MVGAAGQGDKLNVFISYSRDDLAFADQLDAALGLAGFDTSIDRHGISAGEDWKKRLGAFVRETDTVVFVLSPSSAEDWLRQHTDYLRQAHQWEAGGRPANRLLSGDDIAEAKDWAAAGLSRIRPIDQRLGA